MTVVIAKVTASTRAVTAAIRAAPARDRSSPAVIAEEVELMNSNAGGAT
jgi:hypothetical protein